MVLTHAGFDSRLVNIDFNEVQASLNENGIDKTTYLEKVVKNGIFSNITFQNCKDINFNSDYEVFSVEVANCIINQSTLENNVYNCKFLNCSFHQVEFKTIDIDHCIFHNVTKTNCKFVNTCFTHIDAVNFHLKNCNMVNARWTNINLIKDEYVENNIDANTQFENTGWDEQHFLNYLKNDKPVVIVIYSPEDGVLNTNSLLNFYRKYDLNLILIHLNIGLGHPVFQLSALICGIILLGGPHVTKVKTHFASKQHTLHKFNKSSII